MGIFDLGMPKLDTCPYCGLQTTIYFIVLYFYQFVAFTFLSIYYVLFVKHYTNVVCVVYQCLNILVE
jgi:hypothetical protein